MAIKTCVGQVDSLADSFVRERFVPSRQTLFAVFHILITQHLIQRITHGHFALVELTILNHSHADLLVGDHVIANGSAREMPDFASRRLASTSWVLLPIDETIPIPVTTTRLITPASSLHCGGRAPRSTYPAAKYPG